MKIKNKKLLVAGSMIIAASGLIITSIPRNTNNGTLEQKVSNEYSNKSGQWIISNSYGGNNSTKIIEPKGENALSCGSSELEKLMNLPHADIVSYFSSLPHHELMDILTCDQYGPVLTKDILKDIFFKRYDPETKWKEMVDGSPELIAELTMLEDILVDNGEYSFVFNFRMSFLNALYNHVGEIDYLGEGAYIILNRNKRLLLKHVQPQSDIDDVGAKLLGEYAEYAKNKYLYNDNKRAIAGFSLRKSKYGMDPELKVSISDTKELYRKIMQTTPTIEELTGVICLIKRSLQFDELDLIKKTLYKLLDERIEEVLDPLKRMKYTLSSEISQNEWDITDFGFQPSAIPGAYWSAFHKKDINEESAINIFRNEYVNILSNTAYKHEFIDGVYKYAKKNNRTKFTEEVSKYFPEVRENNN